MTDYLFATCGTILDQGTVYRNTDAANSGVWTPVLTESEMERASLAIAPSEPMAASSAPTTPAPPQPLARPARAIRPTAK